MTHATIETLEERQKRLAEQLAETKQKIRDRKASAMERMAAAYGKEIAKLQAEGLKIPKPERLAKLVREMLEQQNQERSAVKRPRKKKRSRQASKAPTATTPA